MGIDGTLIKFCNRGNSVDRFGTVITQKFWSCTNKNNTHQQLNNNPYMDKNTGPPTNYTNRSYTAMLGMKLLGCSFVLMLMPEKVWDAVHWWLLCNIQLSAVTLDGPPLCHWVAVVSKPFDFAIMPLTADRVKSRREEIPWTDLFQWTHLVTVPVQLWSTYQSHAVISVCFRNVIQFLFIYSF